MNSFDLFSAFNKAINKQLKSIFETISDEKKIDIEYFQQFYVSKTSAIKKSKKKTASGETQLLGITILSLMKMIEIFS